MGMRTKITRSLVCGLAVEDTNAGAPGALALDSTPRGLIRSTILMCDAETFYQHQQSIGTVWGVVLPSWDELSWEERLSWEDRYNEQLTRDKEAPDS